MNTPEQQLSESLLAACKAAGIEKPRYIAQDQDGSVQCYTKKPAIDKKVRLWYSDYDDDTVIDHPPYADDWRDSLLEWVEPQGEPLAEILAQHGDIIGDTTEMVILYDVADTSKKVDDACEIAHHAHIQNGNGFRWSPLPKWQDALAWKGGSQ